MIGTGSDAYCKYRRFIETPIILSISLADIEKTSMINKRASEVVIDFADDIIA